MKRSRIVQCLGASWFPEKKSVDTGQSVNQPPGDTGDLQEGDPGGVHGPDGVHGVQVDDSRSADEKPEFVRISDDLEDEVDPNFPEKEMDDFYVNFMHTDDTPHHRYVVLYMVD